MKDNTLKTYEIPALAVCADICDEELNVLESKDFKDKGRILRVRTEEMTNIHDKNWTNDNIRIVELGGYPKVDIHRTKTDDDGNVELDTGIVGSSYVRDINRIERQAPPWTYIRSVRHDWARLKRKGVPININTGYPSPLTDHPLKAIEDKRTQLTYVKDSYHDTEFDQHFEETQYRGPLRNGDEIDDGESFYAESGDEWEHDPLEFRQMFEYYTAELILEIITNPDPLIPSTTKKTYKEHIIPSDDVEYISLVDHFPIVDKYTPDPFSDVGYHGDHYKPNECSAIYAVATPAEHYRFYAHEGLDQAFNTLANDTGLIRYTDIDKIIIDNNVKLEMIFFTIDRGYSVKPSFYNTLFERYKRVEIVNTYFEVRLPSGEIELDELTLKNCILIPDNTTIIIKDKLQFDNMRITADKLTSLIIKFEGTEISLSGNKIVGPVDIRIISTLNEGVGGGDINIMGTTFNINNDTKDVGGAWFNVISFDNVTMINTIKAGGTISRSSLLNIRYSKDVMLSNVTFNDEHVSSENDIIIDDYVSVLVTEFNHYNPNANTGSSLHFKNGQLGSDVTISGSKVTRDKFAYFSNCEKVALTYDECILDLKEVYRVLNADIESIDILGGSVKFTGDIELNGGSFDGTTISTPGIVTCNISAKFNFTGVKFNIGDMRVVYTTSKTTSKFTECVFNNPKSSFGIGYDPEEGGIVNKLDFINCSFKGDELEISEIVKTAVKYSDIRTTNVRIEKIEHLKLDRAIVFCDSVNDFSLDTILKFPNCKITSAGEGTIDYNFAHVIGKLEIETSEDSTYGITMDTCGMGVKFIGDSDSKVSFTSDKSKSSSVITNSEDITIMPNPASSDVKLFKRFDDTFAFNKSGKGLYKSVYYGYVE